MCLAAVKSDVELAELGKLPFLELYVESDPKVIFLLPPFVINNEIVKEIALEKHLKLQINIDKQMENGVKMKINQITTMTLKTEFLKTQNFKTKFQKKNSRKKI